MAEIRILSPHVANLIAAGEVVERPSSVVKELVENAVDAGATAVSVEILNGGIDSIRVTDNGCGIPASDCRTAFLPHATSKIASAEDISGISTLGFRGEALPSIAAVAEVLMKTRVADAENGTEIRADYGKIGDPVPCACTSGTMAEVQNLFSKTPARYKFLKSSRTEAGYIGDYLARMIMAHPDISFTYVNNGKTVYHSYGDGDLKTAVFCVYGNELIQNLLKVDYEDDYVSVRGYIGSEVLNYPNRSRMTLFLNGRYIQSRPISTAILESYATKLMSGRFPFAVLDLGLPFKEVDVNVHPSKMEVRFADERRVYTAVLNACRNALAGLAHTVEKPSVLLGGPGPVPAYAETPPANFNVRPFSRDTDVVHPGTGSDVTVSYKKTNGFLVESYAEERRPDIPFYSIKKKPETPQMTLPVTEEFPKDSFRIVGSVFSGYWIIEQGDNMFLIDQHAAHERILYEKLMSREIETASQRLLSPIPVRVSDVEYATLIANRDEIEAFGFEILTGEDPHMISVAATPVLNGAVMPPVSIIDIADGLAAGKGPDAKEYCRSVLVQASCKHAIKVTETVSEAEISRLLDVYQKEGIPLTCPHGRPVVVLLTKLDFEKMFKRVL